MSPRGLLARSTAAGRAAKAAARVRRETAEFLPAAHELTETPPSPAGRMILWLIIASALGALLWAFLAQVEVVSVAEGRLAPAGRLRTVEAAEPGVVREIAVREGDRVVAGQVLIALDTTMADADRQAARSELETAVLARARAAALLGATFRPPAGAAGAAIDAEREVVLSRRRELDQRLAGLQERRRAAAATVRVSQANIEKLQQTVPLAETQVRAYQTLADRGFGSQIRLTQERERFINLTADLLAERARHDEAEAQVEALAREMAQARAEFRGTAAREQAEAEGVVATREEQLRKADRRSAFQMLRAPVAGTVQEVALTTLGQVAEPGKALVTIVPRGEPLVVEALILNRDVGAVAVGDSAVVKLEAFPFTRYGAWPGRVVRISPDAIVDERRGLVFPATLELGRAPAAARGVRLSPGMSLTAEVVTGRRRVIDYIWSPMARATSEAGRER